MNGYETGTAPQGPLHAVLSRALRKLVPAFGLVGLASVLSAAPRLEWRASPGGHRSLAVTPAGPGRVGFTSLAPRDTGLAFTNHLSDVRATENQIRLIGSGVALGDVDGGGWTDVYLCGLEGPNALYRNLGGCRFENITASAGVACRDQYSTGCALADLDGDGDLDLLVNSIGGGTRLFFNDGTGRFTESANSGLLRRYCATSLALGDVDGDGDLDLYVANYRTTTIRSTGMKMLVVNGRRVLRPEDRDEFEMTPDGFIREKGEPHALYRNDGQGRFEQVSWTGGAFLDEDGRPLKEAPRDWGLSAMFRDLNADGAPDLYVCNDFWSPDRAWINESRDGQVRFRAIDRLALRNTSTFSMGVDFADFNRDGFDDFIVLDMMSRDHARRLRQRSLMGQGTGDVAQIDARPQIERNTLFLNRGDTTFAEIAQLGGVQASEWSWGVAFLDADLDGFEDLLITTGHAFDTQDADAEARLDAMGPAPEGKTGQRLLEFPRLHVPNVAFRNRGDLTFEECSARWGFDQSGVSHGLALGDLDNDGDLDVVVNNLNAPAGVYRNESAAPRIAVRLKGRAPNTRGIGARIRVEGGPVAQGQEMISGGRYLSSDAAERVFAARTTREPVSIEVLWRNGSRTRLPDAAPNSILEIDEAVDGAPAARQARSATARSQIFKSVASFQHVHRDEPFDDFAVQPLLPRRLSQLGPGVSWIDLDADGWDDLAIGAGRGEAISLFRNRAGAGFDRMRAGGVLGRAPDDFATVLGVATTPTNVSLLVGLSNYESTPTNLPAVLRFEITSGRMQAVPPLAPLPSSPGPLAMTDVDGDGDLDLFVGGRIHPGRYPEPATSRLYASSNGNYFVAQEWPRFALASGAAFIDLNRDGFPELLVACEWGPLRILRNERGRFSEWIPPVVGHPVFTNLSQLLGFWNGVTGADLDGDGRMDLLASNWGRNTPEQPFLGRGWQIYAGDFGGRGTFDLVEALFDESHQRLVPWRDLDTLARSLPWLRERFPNNAAFANASLEQILGPRLASATELRVTCLDSVALLNRDDRFELRPLPIEAQFAPAFGLCAGDVDGDGIEDVFLGGNFFGSNESVSRFDAGRGLWLRGNGRGGFAALSAGDSGVAVHGEQRGAALCDYDADGCWDFALAQNRAPTHLFRNETGRPGLRVRLRGPPGNASGVGAALRLETPGGTGPARELRAGGGYWSQDGVVQILHAPGFPGAAARLLVRWPGGATTLTDVPQSALEVSIDAGGRLTVLRDRAQ